MTSSKSSTLTYLLNKNDFAELAKERKRQQIIEKKEAEEKEKKEERLAAEKKAINALPQITEEDLKKAEQTGYQKGLEEGKKGSSVEFKEELNKRLGNMQTKLQNIPELLQTEIAYIQKNTLQFTQHILNKFLKDAHTKYSSEILEFMLKEALEEAPHNISLMVKLSPADRFYLQEKGDGILNNKILKFKEDESIQQGDCILEWDNCGVDARFENILNELDKFIQAASDHISPETIELTYKKHEVKQEGDGEKAPEDVKITANSSEDVTTDKENKEE